MKIPSLKIYQNYARIYLDEYEGQEELRCKYFLDRLKKHELIAQLIGEPYISSIADPYNDGYTKLLMHIIPEEENPFLTDFIKKRFLKRQ